MELSGLSASECLHRLKPSDPQKLNVAQTTKQHTPITVVPQWKLEIKIQQGQRGCINAQKLSVFRLYL